MAECNMMDRLTNLKACPVHRYVHGMLKPMTEAERLADRKDRLETARERYRVAKDAHVANPTSATLVELALAEAAGRFCKDMLEGEEK